MILSGYWRTLSVDGIIVWGKILRIIQSNSDKKHGMTYSSVGPQAILWNDRRNSVKTEWEVFNSFFKMRPWVTKTREEQRTPGMRREARVGRPVISWMSNEVNGFAVLTQRGINRKLWSGATWRVSPGERGPVGANRAETFLLPC